MDIEALIQSYVKHGQGVVEIMGANVQEAGAELNRYSRKAGIKTPVFCEGNAKYWAHLQNEPRSRLEEGGIYKFRLAQTSSPFFLKALAVENIDSVEASPPNGIIALAEACERYLSSNKSSLFCNSAGDILWVVSGEHDVALWSGSEFGVEAVCFDADPNGHGFSVLSTLRYVPRPSLLED